jgi:dihydropteroate synthase
MDAVLHRASQMVSAGAHILDVGGESTRPGANPVSEQDEIDRVVPVVERLRSRFPVPVSVDTSTASVIHESATAGASLINDVRALRRPGALEAAAASGLPVCLMHMRGEPVSMQQQPHYRDPVQEVGDFLLARVDACIAAGIDPAHIIIDPGFGFGKTLEHNLALFRGLPAFCALGYPVLVGLSRKRMIGDILGKSELQRLHGSLALALMAVQSGASIVRVHDVAATVEVLDMFKAVQEMRK